MKRTFQVVSAALLLTVASVTAQAQGGGGGGGGRGMGGGRGGWEQQKTMLLKDITLTPQQTTSIDSIAKVYTDKQMELRGAAGAGGPPSEEVMAKMRALAPERNEAIKKLLTPDQAKQFDTNVAAMPQGRGRGGL
ncbi:MAG: hypothetical protein ACO1Q7_01060 [Gemmatimonas sp.]